MMARLKESRWVFILLSILLAVIFWMYIRIEVDPTQTTTIHNVRVETTGTNVLNSQGLTVAELSNQVVELRVEAPSSVLDDLVRYRSSLYVRADVSSCVEGENSVKYRPVWPENLNNVEDLRLLDQEPSAITVTVEKLYTQPFPVQFQLEGRVAENYQMGTPAIEPEQVIVGGPVEQVNQVDKVVAILQSEELSQRFAGDLPLIPLDSEGNPLTGLEITLSSETAYVVVPVVMTKEVRLTVNIQPGGGATEDDADIEDIKPNVIVVSGAEADLEGLEEISLGSINLADVVDSYTFTLPINLDPSLTNESGLTTAAVKVTVKGLDTKTFAVEDITTTIPPSGYVADVVTQSLTVTVRGPREDLEKIDVSQLRVVADLSEAATLGSSRVPAKVYLNGTSTVGVIGKYTVVVDIRR